MEMTKFLNKLFLFGIILGGANLDAANRGMVQTEQPSIFEQFYSVDFSNNAASNKNTISAEVNYESGNNEHHVIGYYDENEYLEYTDINKKKKVVKILCRLNDDNIGSEYNLGNKLSVYPIGNKEDGFYFLGKQVSDGNNPNNKDRFPVLKQNSACAFFYVNNDAFEEKAVMDIFNDDTGEKLANQVVFVRLGGTYKVETFGDTKVLKEAASKPLAYERDTQTQEWVTLNSKGTEGDPLNKAKVLIDQGASITMKSNSTDPLTSGPSIITVTKFGELENKGTLTLKNRSLLQTPNMILTDGEHDAINELESKENLDAVVAVNNEGGEIVVEAGGAIMIEDGVIKGGKVDLSGLIEIGDQQNPALASTDSVSVRDIDLTASFYNAELVITKEAGKIANFQNISNPLFSNVKFYSDLEGKTRHSTVQMPVSGLSYSNDLTVLRQYNTLLPLVYASPTNIGTEGKFSDVEKGILRMFSLNPDSFEDRSTCPLQFSVSTGQNLYEFMTGIADVISNARNELGTVDNLAVDLFSFSFDSPEINYIKFKDTNGSFLEDLRRVQFVCNNESAQNKNLKLLPSTDENATSLTVSQEFNNWPGTLSFAESVKPLTFENEVRSIHSGPFYTYNVKLNNEVELITKGNIVLNLANSGELTLGKFEHTGGILHINSLSGEELLIKVKAGKDYTHTGRGAVYYHGPVSLTLTA